MATLDPDDIFIAVMGMTGAGKTKFVTDCTEESAEDEFHSLESCTLGVTIHTMSLPNMDKRICLIDTPGFDDTNRSDADILQEIAFWLVKSYQLGVRLSGIVYLHNITETRVKGSAVQGLKIFKAICGIEAFHGITMATTFWDKVGMGDMHQADKNWLELQQNVNFWKELIDGGCSKQMLSAGRTSAMQVVQGIANRDIRLVLKMQSQLVDERLLIYETDAGKQLKEAWFQERSGLLAEIKETREHIMKALAANEKDREKELETHHDELYEKLRKRKTNVLELEQPTTVITSRWEEKAMEALEWRTTQHGIVQEKLELARLKLERMDSDTSEYDAQKEEVTELLRQREVADRLKSIQIASHTMNLSQASLATAVVTGLVGTVGAAAAVAPLLCSVISQGWVEYEPCLGMIVGACVMTVGALQASSAGLLCALYLPKQRLGQACHFRDASEAPLKTTGVLGKGSFGHVDRVLSTITYKEYARKSIPRVRAFKQNRGILRLSEKELSSLKELASHRHIIEFVGSYTDPRYVGIIISPVAECNLQEYLTRDLNEGARSFLRTFLGCLAKALCFLHDNRIRHKDIEPQNVLVRGGRVLLTGFGLALDWGEISSGNAEGPTWATPRLYSTTSKSNKRGFDIKTMGFLFFQNELDTRGE
ncbi:hypothetical protein OPT61_g3543 [Boeremia exigua]|uniref:Uncharacterized protein n=1 Tax=Boeremia exigua TaxID=749465 RepID=A0ACC2IHG0_9PLEO|nr:hypothetical protein OPT61_g3543 [Boeremia exigua]